MKKWIDYEFESSSSTTEEFVSFDLDLKKNISKTLAGFGIKIIKWNRGHFESSCFARNESNGKIVYISYSDVRYFKNSWLSDLLIRTAEHEKDYRGGNNNSANLADIGIKALALTGGK